MIGESDQLGTVRMGIQEFRPAQNLYLYTSVQGFNGIVSSKRLWFSDLSMANDPRELDLGYNRFIEALRSVRHTEYKGHPRGLHISIFAGNLTGYYVDLQAFSVCFSLERDRLPMWGAYGSNYAGISLGFRPTSLFDIPARMQRVNYVDEHTDTDFRNLALEVAAAIEVGSWSMSDTIAAVAAITALKHDSWSHEREVRLVHIQKKTPLSDEERQDLLEKTGMSAGSGLGDWTPALTRSVNGRDVSYIEFPFGRHRGDQIDYRGAISEIVLGPNCPMSADDARAVMEVNGYRNFTIARSDCIIR